MWNMSPYSRLCVCERVLVKGAREFRVSFELRSRNIRRNPHNQWSKLSQKREREREQEWGNKKLSCFYAIRFECIEQCERAFILANILLILTGNDKKESFLEYIFMVQRCFWGPHSQRHHPREHKNSEKKNQSRGVYPLRFGVVKSFLSLLISSFMLQCARSLIRHIRLFFHFHTHTHTHTCKRWCLEFRANIYWCRN